MPGQMGKRRHSGDASDEDNTSDVENQQTAVDTDVLRGMNKVLDDRQKKVRR